MARRKGLYEVDGELVSERTPPARWRAPCRHGGTLATCLIFRVQLTVHQSHDPSDVSGDSWAGECPCATALFPGCRNRPCGGDRIGRTANRHWVCRRKHWVLRDRIAVAPADCTQGRHGQGRFRAVGLSSFRTYPARLSAGYRGFRSGENESSLGKRPRFPDGAEFSPNASDKRAPGSPQPGAVPLQICCAR
jgi:hypothetical protein